MEAPKELRQKIIKFSVKFHYDKLSQDTMIDVLNYFENAKVNGTLKKARKIFRLLHEYHNHDSSSYELKIKLRCITPQKDENMAIFGTLDTTSKKIKELHLKIEGSLTQAERNIHIKNAKDIVFKLEDKSKSQFCYLCENIYDSNFFHDYFNYGVRPYCLNCNSLSSKERSKIKQQRLKKIKAKKAPKQKVYDDIEKINDIKLHKAEKELYRYEYFHEHGEYPIPTKSDNNVIYVWKHDDMYKIGITSKRAGKKRIWHVAKQRNMRADVLHYEEVENALALEKELLTYGTKVHFDFKFDGSTEFRYLTEEELESITEIIQQWKIIY